MYMCIVELYIYIKCIQSEVCKAIVRDLKELEKVLLPFLFSCFSPKYDLQSLMATYHHRYNSTGGTQNGDSVIVIRLGEVDTVYFQDLVSRPKSTLSWPVGIHLRHDYSLRQKAHVSHTHLLTRE